MTDEKIPCTPQHEINGYVPQVTDKHLANQVCDCKKLIFLWINSCGCRTPKMELIARPNTR